MPCDPRLGKILVLSAMFRCVLPMMCVAACLTRDPFHNSLQNRAEIIKVERRSPPPLLWPSHLWLCGIPAFFQVKDELSGRSFSDYLVFIRAVMGWRRVKSGQDQENTAEYLDRLSLSRFSLGFIKGYSPDVIIHLDVDPRLTQGFCHVALMQVSSLSSAQACMKPSWCHTPTSVSVTRLSATTTAERTSCLKPSCWLDSTPTLSRWEEVFIYRVLYSFASAENLLHCGLSISSKGGNDPTTSFFPPQVKKGAVVKGRFRPNSMSLQALSGPVLLHRSSVNRFACFSSFNFFVCMYTFLFCPFSPEGKKSFPAAG